MKNKKLWFAGTPEFAAYSLSELLKNNLDISLVLTQPDRPKGRGRKLMPSAVKELALANNLEVFQPEKLLKSDFENKEAPDLIIVAAYGLLLPEWFLNFPKYGCINIHASLLPRWRGAAPIQRAIEAGDEKTGISIMQMDKGLDTGAVWQMAELEIKHKTAQILHEELKILGAETLLKTLPKIFNGNAKPQPQPEEGAIYAKKLTKEEALINWTEHGEVIARKIRAFNLMPIAFAKSADLVMRFYDAVFEAGNFGDTAGMVIKHNEFLEIATIGGKILIKNLQIAGKNKITAKDLKNGKNFENFVFSEELGMRSEELELVL